MLLLNFNIALTTTALRYAHTIATADLLCYCDFDKNRIQYTVSADGFHIAPRLVMIHGLEFMVCCMASGHAHECTPVIF